MENQKEVDINSEKFTWIIENFSNKSTKQLRSKAFKLEWLALINQNDSKKSLIKETQQKFNGGYRSWGSTFVHLTDFYNPNAGYLVNNTFIIEAHVCVSDVAFNIQDKLTPTHDSKTDIDQATEVSDETISSTTYDSKWYIDQDSLTESELQHQEYQTILAPSDETPSSEQLYSEPTAPPNSPIWYPSIIIDEPVEVPLTPLSELMDFKSLGPEEAAFVPLLEEVCAWHPSLIESQKRSTKFIHWAFIALGQVVYFLKTKKVKDMSEEGCKQLQGLWEELQHFGFDQLIWLEPYVESALGMKAYLERAGKVKNLEENVDALELEMKKLRSKLIVAEVDLQVAKRDLAEVAKGFEEMDMDAELSFGIF